MKKTILSLLLAVAMIVSLLPVSAFAEETAQVTLGDVTLDATNTTATFGEGTATFDAATSTLTLNNATVSGELSTGMETLNLVVKGENTIDPNSYNYAFAINANRLIISGGGKLSVKNAKYAANCNYFELSGTEFIVTDCQVGIRLSAYGSIRIADNANLSVIIDGWPLAGHTDVHAPLYAENSTIRLESTSRKKFDHLFGSAFSQLTFIDCNTTIIYNPEPNLQQTWINSGIRSTLNVVGGSFTFTAPNSEFVSVEFSHTVNFNSGAKVNIYCYNGIKPNCSLGACDLTVKALNGNSFTAAPSIDDYCQVKSVTATVDDEEIDVTAKGDEAFTGYNSVHIIVTEEEKTIEVPIVKSVIQTGNVAPGEESFSFEILDVLNPETTAFPNIKYTAKIATNGVGDYEGKLIITGPTNEIDDFFSMGFFVAEVNDGAADWTYSDNIWHVRIGPSLATLFEPIIDVIDPDINHSNFVEIYPAYFDAENEDYNVDYQNPARYMSFENSFAAFKEVPIPPSKPEPPKKDGTPIKIGTHTNEQNPNTGAPVVFGKIFG